MKQYIKGFLFVFFCLLLSIDALAQAELITITGVSTQKKNIEVVVWANTGGPQRMVASYTMDATNDKFSLVVPYRANTNYKLRVTTMKMGHMRLERDLSATFPIQLSAKQNMFITLNPTLLDETTQKGIVIEKKAVKFSTASVSGTLTNWKFGGELFINKVVEGRLEKITSFNIEKEDPNFNLLIPIAEEGFYYLSTPRWKKRLYLKPNDQLIADIDGPSGVQTNWIKTTAENQVLAKWDELIQPATVYGYNLDQRHKAILDAAAFSSTYESLQQKITAFLPTANTANAKFNALFKTAVLLDNNLLALRSFLYQSGKKLAFWIPAKEFFKVPTFYKQILTHNKINSPDVLRLGEGNEYLNLYAMLSLDELDEQKRQTLSDGEKLKVMMGAISNETLKSYLLKSQLEDLNVNNYSEFRAVFLPFEKYTKPVSVKWKYNNVLQQFAPDTAFIGKTAYDFALPDVNGKMVSMKDFKGKVILIDVWATWCGPCKAQMPFLKEVEEAYKGNNNLAFVGISLDADKDKQKWLDMIKEKGLEGVQLLDNVGKSFGRKYKINAIPRFLLIDKKGNWVEVRCPLPEDKARLKVYIDRELSKEG